MESWWVPDEHEASLLAAEPRGRGLAELVPEPAAGSLVVAARRCRDEGRPVTVAFDLALAEGRRAYEARVVPLGGRRFGVLALDVTPQATLVEELRRSEERFRLAFKTSPDAIAVNRASDGKYVAVNEGFTALLGWREHEVLGRTSLELGIWVNPEERAGLMDELARRGRARLEGRFRRRRGEQGVGLLSAVLFELDGAPHILSVTRDVTAGGSRRRSANRRSSSRSASWRAVSPTSSATSSTPSASTSTCSAGTGRRAPPRAPTCGSSSEPSTAAPTSPPGCWRSAGGRRCTSSGSKWARC